MSEVSAKAVGFCQAAFCSSHRSDEMGVLVRWLKRTMTKPYLPIAGIQARNVGGLIASSSKILIKMLGISAGIVARHERFVHQNVRNLG